MPTWLMKFAPALFALLKKAVSSLGFLAGYVLGRRSQEGKNAIKSLEAVRRGADAGANVHLDDDSLRKSAANRDSK